MLTPESEDIETLRQKLVVDSKMHGVMSQKTSFYNRFNNRL